MVMFGVSSLDPPKVPSSKESRAKNLIMKAWRERWTDVQWGIHVRALIDTDSDASFIADCILQQALNGPGPNALVLSYLMHSVYSQMISSSAVLKSISQYDGYHKPFCIGSLLDLLDNIKERVILNEEEPDECLQLALAVEATVHWLLTCMYSSLENLSDLAVSDVPVEEEDSKIVTKCRILLEFFLGDTYISALLHIAIVEDPEMYEKIKRMCAEVGKFSGGHNGDDISKIISLVSQLRSFREEKIDSKNLVMCESIDHLQMLPLNGAIQTVIMTAALLRSFKDISNIVTDLLTIKHLKKMSSTNLYCEIVHSTMLGLLGAIGKEQELKFIGFTFFQLPTLLSVLQEKLNDTGDDLASGLDAFITNESALDIIDAKLHCCTLDLLLTNLSKNGLISEVVKANLLAKKGPPTVTSKSNASNAILILKAESTLASVLKTLDGDYVKNQDAILGVLCDMLGKSFELILTAAATTGTLQQVTSRLIKLNQCSRQINGEGSKASATRAMIFDISFLMLCRTVQTYGPESIESEDPDCFFEEWYRNCMVEETAKNPDLIIARCDQNKVDMLLNQYLQGDTELKTSLVFWHEVCTNAVGVVQNLLLAWENGAVSFTDVKKILDVFRSRICSLPVCIAAWLCAYIQVMPEEQCGKARYILDHFLNPVVTEDSQDHFKERCAMMSAIIAKMMDCVQPSTTSTSQTECITESKTTAELLESCFKCMSSRGLLDVETTLNLKSLMEMSGHATFINSLIQESFQIQYSMNLEQWCNLCYGIMQIDLKNCTEAMLRNVVPSLLRFTVGSSHFVEPQLVAVVTLVVDCVLSFYLQNKLTVKSELIEFNDDAEPTTKRRKISLPNKGDISENIALEQLLKDVYIDFEKFLCSKIETSPQVVFILRFLEQMCFKTPDLSLLHSVSNRLVKRLMNLMHEEMRSNLLLGLYNLSDKVGRRNCAQAICALRTMLDN